MLLRLRAIDEPVDAPAGDAVDVTVDVAANATMGELAAALFPHSAQCQTSRDGLGLAVGADTGHRRVLASTTRLDESGLTSGSSVAPARSRPNSSQPTRDPVATLTVLDGPDCPASFELRPGRTSIGRGADRDVRLTDPLVSQRHAHVIVGDTVEIVDDCSANGLMMSGRLVERAVIGCRDIVTLGSTSIVVNVNEEGTDRARRSGNIVAFNRSPRLDPRFDGIELTAPEPPRPPQPHRFPVAMVVAPIALAGVFYLATRSALSVLFFALSPVLVIGGWLETRSASRRQLATETARFRSALADLRVQLEYARALEREGRRREHPSVVEIIEAVDDRGALVWTRRPEHRSFGEVRLGSGTQASRNAVVMPAVNATLPDLWRELNDAVGRYATVDEVPVVADLRGCGNIGVGGPAIVVQPIVRGLIAQFAGLHAPGELQVMACVTPAAWSWLEWLPHTSGASLGGNAAEIADVASRLEAIVGERRAAIDGRVTSDHPVQLPVIVVLVDDHAPIERSRLVQIAERGPAVSVHVVWFAPDVGRLPAACRTFIDLGGGRRLAGFVDGGHSVDDLVTEPMGAAAAVHFGRRLSPLVDSGAAADASAELPGTVDLVDLIGHDLATMPCAVADRWAETVPASGLRALVGRSTAGPIHLDLSRQGPHALVGGTTGSGKSEFLQSWILAMAVEHSPADVTFLLVDYKGGSAFADCVDLPHCVGLVTDLTPRLVRRALASLDAELRHREQLLHDRRAKDLDELARRNDPNRPPRLVIVVDEFAALVADVPEFVDEVVNVAQRGRSLGLHLILATQRPAGVINDHVRANTNLRIALRMADESDADDVIGSTLPATFDPDNAGRAIVKAGHGRLTTFQAGFSGGRQAGRDEHIAIVVQRFRLGSPDVWYTPASTGPAAAETSEAEMVEARPTDAERIVWTVTRAANRLGVAPVRRPWLPELAAAYRLESLPTRRTDDVIVFGVADDPERQQQPVVSFHPDLDGNMAVFGTGGSGKSCALRSLGVAAGFAAARGGPTHVYGLDFGAHGLRPLERLPHVGSVIPGDDTERVHRLLRHIVAMIDERAPRYAARASATITDYRERAEAPDEPRILLLVDGFGSFRSDYEGGPMHVWWDRFVRIVAEGRSTGVHVVLSADRPTSVPSSIASFVQRELVLRLAGDMDVAIAGLPADAFDRDTPAGRGFLDQREVQVAAVGGHGDLAEQLAAIDRCAAAMGRHGVGVAPPIGALPHRIVLSELPTDDGRPVIGVGDETLAAVGFDPTGVFLVVGGPGSGRSTTIASMLRSLSAVRPPTEFVRLGRRRSPLTPVVAWSAVAEGETEISRMATDLAARADALGDRSLVIVIEGVDELLHTAADAPLQDLLRACREHDVFVIAEGDTNCLSGSWPLLQAVKSFRSGIALAPDQLDGEALFATPFPRTNRAEFPAGRGLMVQGGRVIKVQVALPT